jgi:hypothetical protein
VWLRRSQPCGPPPGRPRLRPRPGFHVTGVDLKAQPNYCGDVFILGDAIEFLATADLSAFDFTGASPPCQHYTSLRFGPGEHRNADLIGLTREALKKTGKPWALENVVGAPLRALIDLRLDLKLIALEAITYRVQVELAY